jgi:hypothetical protein
MGTDDMHLRSLLSEAITTADPSLRDRLLTDPEAYLDLVTITANARTETDTLLRLAVAGARSAGLTWEAVGRSLGMTKQAAQQRYGTPDAEEPAAADEPGAAGEPRADGRIHQLARLNLFTEMKALENAQRYGWHLVGAGTAMLVVRKSDVQWEHQRVFASRAQGRALEEQGWQHAVDGWFPWAYYKRATDSPALPEPLDDSYLGRSTGGLL